MRKNSKTLSHQFLLSFSPLMKKVKNISNTFLFSFAVLLVVNPATVEELANEVTEY